jgi:hypothetical protein
MPFLPDKFSSESYTFHCYVHLEIALTYLLSLHFFLGCKICPTNIYQFSQEGMFIPFQHLLNGMAPCYNQVP